MRRAHGGIWPFWLGVRPWYLAFLGLSLGLGAMGWPASIRAEPRGDYFPVTAADTGESGVLESPTARFYPDGTFFSGASYVAPNRHFYLGFQALPWLQATFRYTGLGYPYGSGNEDYFDRSFNVRLHLLSEGDYQPALALGFRDLVGTGLFSSEYLVASKRYGDFDFSLGLGWGRLGSLGDLANPLARLSDRFKNRSGGSGGTGGTPRLGSWFSGDRMGVFGGLEYRTPMPGLHLKAEVSGNALERLTRQSSYEQGSRFNYGVSYRWGSAEVGVAYENDSRLMARVTFHTSPDSKVFERKIEPPPQPVPPRKGVRASPLPSEAPLIAVGPASERSEEAEAEDSADEQSRSPAGQVAAVLRAMGAELERITFDEGRAVVVAQRARRVKEGEQGEREVARAVAQAFPDQTIRLVVLEEAGESPASPIARIPIKASKTDQGTLSAQTEAEIAQRIRSNLEERQFQPLAIEVEAKQLVVHLAGRRYRRSAKGLGRVSRVAAAEMPPTVQQIRVVHWQNGIPVSNVQLPAREVVRALNHDVGTEAVFRKGDVASVDPDQPEFPDQAFLDRGWMDRLSWGVEPEVLQQLMDPAQPFRYQLGLRANASFDLSQGLQVASGVVSTPVGNLEDAPSDPDSVLPHVRSDINKYLSEGQTGISHLQMDGLGVIGEDLYARLSAGLFERMYGGVGGGVLYRPVERSWALGMDVNLVKKRDFGLGLGFRDYSVTTGHVSWYQELPWYGLEGRVHAGRYLARDWGATFQMAREFDSGMRVGGFFTLTDVPFDKFGEGSFDKGIFMTFPFDMFSPTPTTSKFSYTIKPLTRDGGQRLKIQNRLYEMTESGREEAVFRHWPAFAD